MNWTWSPWNVVVLVVAVWLLYLAVKVAEHTHAWPFA